MEPKTTKLCEVSSCENTVRYECPRCGIEYCSVPCYQNHSSVCLKAFSTDSTKHLRGVYATSEDREKFNAIVDRIRNDETLELAPPDPIQQKPNETNEEQIQESDDDDDENAGQLLQKLMSELDEKGKDALFTVLQTAMEHTEGINATPTELRSVINDNNQQQEQDENPSSPRRPRSIQKSDITDEPENNENDDIADTLQALVDDMELMDLSAEAMFNRLPAFMQSDFENAIKKGRLRRLVSLWTPWWVSKDSLDSALPALPHTNTLGVKPHAAVIHAHKDIIFTVADIICAYCCSMRLCNGDWRADPCHAADKIYENSVTLRRGAKPGSMAEVTVEEKFDVGVLQDLEALLMTGDNAVVRALGDVMELYKQAMADMAKGERRRMAKNAVRKLGFVTAWAIGQEEKTWIALAREVLKEITRREGLDREVTVAKEVGERMKKMDEARKRKEEGSLHPGIKIVE